MPNADYVIPVNIEGTVHHVHVIKRPCVDEFMERVGRLFEVIVFTASLAKYADPLLDQLDIHGVVHGRLFREHCTQYQGNFVKDLTRLGRQVSQTIIIDNSPASYMFQPENAIGCTSFIDNQHDRELLYIADFLESLVDVEVRGRSESLTPAFSLSHPPLRDVSLPLRMSQSSCTCGMQQRQGVERTCRSSTTVVAHSRR